MNEQHTRIREHYPSARRDYRPLVGLVAVAVGLVALVLIVNEVRDAVDPLRREQAAAAAYRASDQAQRLQWADDVSAAGWKLFPLALLSGLGSVALLIVYRRFATHEYIKAYHLTHALEAQRQSTPQTLTYSPHITHQRDARALADDEEQTPALTDAGVPTFAQLLDRGKVGAGNPLMLGYDVATGAPLDGSWLDLYSTAVSGMPGSGKTTSQRFLACQTALHGARFAICDPHAGAADDSLGATLDPLRAAFVCEPASSDKAILEVVRYVADVGRRRVEGSDKDTTPLILWVDELTSLLGRSSIADELAELLERVAQEYRKRAVFVCASGQIWTAARTTSELRDSFASVLCHRMKRAQARLLLPTEEAEQVERLQTGRAVLWRTSGVTSVVQMPLTTAQDVRRVAGLLNSSGRPLEPHGRLVDASGTPERTSDGLLMDIPPRTESSASGRANPLSAMDARILGLFQDGADAAEIVRQLWPDAKPGRAMQERSGQVQAALRRALSTQKV